MLPSVCFEIGRFTQTQSSWTVVRYCSRKWMSGQVYALASAKDRQLVTSLSALRKYPSARGPASPLDFYLSWMSPVYPQDRLILDGSIDGHQVHMELQLVDPNKFLLVRRGFHWIQEFSLNR